MSMDFASGFAWIQEAAAARRSAERGLHRGHRGDDRGQLDLHGEVVEGTSN